MDSGSHKLYHVHDVDARCLLDTYYSDKPENVFGDDSLKFPVERLHNLFKEGHIKGEVMMDISVAFLVHHLYSACGFFKAIYLLKFNERCIMELNRWLHTRTGAFSWNHTSTYVTELDGTSDQWEDKEKRLKASIKQIVKCDHEKQYLTDPVVLPLADCIISVFLLEVLSKDQDDYTRNFRKIKQLLKPRGRLILVGTLEASYITDGSERFHIFNYDEDYIRRFLSVEGFVIDGCDILQRKAVSDLMDYKAVHFITAHREK